MTDPNDIFGNPDIRTPNDLRLFLTLDRKINLGNYESASVGVGISGITTETTPEEIDELLAGRVVYEKLKARLTELIAKERKGT